MSIHAFQRLTPFQTPFCDGFHFIPGMNCMLCSLQYNASMSTKILNKHSFCMLLPSDQFFFFLFIFFPLPIAYFSTSTCTKMMQSFFFFFYKSALLHRLLQGLQRSCQVNNEPVYQTHWLKKSVCLKMPSPVVCCYVCFLHMMNIIL